MDIEIRRDRVQISSYAELCDVGRVVTEARDQLRGLVAADIRSDPGARDPGIDDLHYGENFAQMVVGEEMIAWSGG